MSRAQSPTDLELTWDQALAWRIGRQHLATRAADPVALVGQLAGVQAQVLPSAKQVIGIRSRATPDDVDRLLWTERRLVRTWAMRGTLHLLPSDELGLWAALLGRRQPRITPGWERYHGLTGAELAAITEAVPAVLDADPITREELARRIAARVKKRHLAEVVRSGWAAVLKPAANQGLLVQGPPVDGNVTFVDPERWLGRSLDRPDPHEAAAELVDRFLDVNGPATHDDLARWLGVQPKQGRELLAEHTDRLLLVDVEGDRAWMTPAGARQTARTRPKHSVYLLPGFDPYVLAPISHRRHTIPPGRVDEVSRTAGWISAVLLVDGRIAGTWTAEPATDVDGDTVVTIRAFDDLAPDVLAAAERHLRSHSRGVFGSGRRVEVRLGEP
jgi:Winged helix DNA-binding domain